MVITADGALALTRLNLELAIQQRNAAQDSDSLQQLNECVASLAKMVGFWEDRVAAEKAAAAEA